MDSIKKSLLWNSWLVDSKEKITRECARYAKNITEKPKFWESEVATAVRFVKVYIEEATYKMDTAADLNITLDYHLKNTLTEWEIGFNVNGMDYLTHLTQPMYNHRERRYYTEQEWKEMNDHIISIIKKKNNGN